MPRSDMYAIPGKDAPLDYEDERVCPHEHTGDPYTQTDVLGTDWERWTCCDDETPLED